MILFHMISQVLVSAEFSFTLAADIAPLVLEMSLFSMSLQGAVGSQDFWAEFTWPGFLWLIFFWLPARGSQLTPTDRAMLCGDGR